LKLFLFGDRYGGLIRGSRYSSSVFMSSRMMCVYLGSCF